jgi:hypothetical protein
MKACNRYFEGLLDLSLFAKRTRDFGAAGKRSTMREIAERESAGCTDLLRRACFGGSRYAKTFAAVWRAGDVLCYLGVRPLGEHSHLVRQGLTDATAGGTAPCPTFSRHARRRTLAARAPKVQCCLCAAQPLPVTPAPDASNAPY